MGLFRLLFRLIRALLYLALLLAVIPFAGFVYGYATTGLQDTTPLPGVAEGAPSPELAQRVRASIPGYRDLGNAFMTYPEWSTIHAARDYANFLRTNRESGFPYFSYVGRYWQEYAVVSQTESSLGAGFSNRHLLLLNGAIHSIQYVVQGVYELTVGNVTGWTSGRPLAVDTYQAGVAAEYAAFVGSNPWYRFPFAQKRAGLLDIEPALIDDLIRTYERKAAFAFADTANQAAADQVAKAFGAAAAPADIHVWARGPVASAIAGEPGTRLELDLGADGAVFSLRRGRALTDMVPRLVASGVSFVEIGGGDEILVTVLSSNEITAPDGTRKLFSHRIPAEPSLRRTAFRVAVRQLHEVLPALAATDVRLEHIYD